MAAFDYDGDHRSRLGGPTATRLSRFFDERVVLIDEERLGGDCLYHGCVPSEALIKASRVAQDAATADRWGLGPADVRGGIGPVNARVQKAVAEVGGLDDGTALTEIGAVVLLGGATFLDPHRLQVGDREITT